ncbi:MAG: molybdopterin-dependent oxidoreductase [Nitrospirae bacterium]|nr:molybdopterin-dependent oxidoreductase [Nitrospirota bacterium]
MIKVTRRDFLKGSVAIGVAGALSGTVLNTLKPSKAYAEESTAAWRPTGCLGCTTWCAVEAKVQTDTGVSRVVDIRGNQKAKTHDGYVCPRGRMGIQEMYDADRVKMPLKRIGSTRGPGAQFIPISWDDAVTEIATKMIEIRYTPDTDDVRHEGPTGSGVISGTSTTLTDTSEVLVVDKYKGYLIEIESGTGSGQIRMITTNTADTYTVSPAWDTIPDGTSVYKIMPSQAHKSLVLRGRYSAVNDVSGATLYEAVPTIYGSPNKVSHSSICAEAEKGAWQRTTGYADYMDYDLTDCKYLVLWGVDPTSSNRMVPNAIRKLGDRMKNGMKTVVVDPRLSPSAAKAHRWLPVKPGTDGALALAIAYWIIKNSTLGYAGTSGPIALPTVPHQRLGLDRWWELELNDVTTPKTPTWASALTGISALTIKQVACEFIGYNYDASGNPTTQMSDRIGNDQCKAISWLGPGVAMQPNGLYGAMAAAALNGLAASFDHKGGVVRKKIDVTGLGSLIAASGYKDAISDYPGAKIANYKRYYARYVNSGPEIPLDMPGMKSTLGDVTPTNRVGDSLKDGMPYNPDPEKNCKIILSHFTNFPFSCGGVSRWDQALKHNIYQVAMVTNASEQAMYADIVLPSDHHMFENYLFSAGQRANFANVVSMMKPVVNRLWDTKWCETEFVWDLAYKMADIGVGTVVAGWPANYYFTKLKEYVDAYGAATDSWDFNVKVQKKWGTNNSDAVWNKLISDDPNDYDATNEATGGAYGYGIRQGVIPSSYFDSDGRGSDWNSASYKFYFNARTGNFGTNLQTHATNHGTTLQGVITACKYEDTAARMTATDADAANDIAFMPHWEDPNIDDGSAPTVYKYTLIDYKSRLNREGRSANCPWYHEFKSCDAGDEKWSDVVKINPIDAVTLGVVDGDTVKITSPSNSTGGITCKVKVWAGVRSGTVAKSYGQGHWAYGRYAAKTFGSAANGGNNNEVIPAEWERITGATARNGCVKVKIEKVV